MNGTTFEDSILVRDTPDALLNPILVRVLTREVRRRLQGLRDFVERGAASARPERLR